VNLSQKDGTQMNSRETIEMFSAVTPITREAAQQGLLFAQIANAASAAKGGTK